MFLRDTTFTRRSNLYVPARTKTTKAVSVYWVGNNRSAIFTDFDRFIHQKWEMRVWCFTPSVPQTPWSERAAWVSCLLLLLFYPLLIFSLRFKKKKK